MITLNQSPEIVVELTYLAASNKKSVIHVLHVDDDPSLQEITKLMLQDLDSSFEIDCACCVDEAFGKLAVGNYDVVISDYEMPKKDGLQFLKELREQNNDIPFILFTGKGREEVAIAALNFDADGYFNKQGDPETVYGELVHGIQLSVGKRKAENRIRQEEEKLKAVFAASPDAIILFDLNGRIVDCNQATAALHGYESMEEAVGKSILEHVAKKDHKRALEGMTQGLVKDLKLTFITKGGREYPVEVSGNVVLDALGKPAYFMAITKDITERNKVEEEMRKSKLILENSSDSIVVTDLQGKIVSWNKGSCDIFGYSAQEMLGENVTKLVKPMEKEKVAPGQLNQIRNGQDFSQELEGVRKDGSPVWLILTTKLLKNSQNDPIGMVGFGKDITERKQAEGALLESETKFRLYVEYSPVALFVVNLEGKYEYVNQAAAELLGYSVDELTTMSIPQITYDMDLQIVAQSFIRLKEKGFLHEETRLKSKGGNIVFVDLNAIALPNGKLMAFCENITERKKSEEALINSESILQRIFDVLPVGLWFADKDGKLLRGNPAGVKIWGAEPKVGPSEYGVFKARRLPSGEEISQNDWALAHTIKDKVTVVDELLEIDAFDGKKKTILNYTAPVLDAKGDILGAIVVNQDITKSKKIEAELRESRKKYQDLTETTNDFIWETDPQGRYTYCSPQMENLWGLKPKEMIGKTPFDMMPPVDREKASEYFGELANSPKPFNMESSAYDSQGHLVYLETNGVPFFDGQGRLLGFRGISRDITERKQADEAVRESEKKHRKLFEESLDAIFLADAETGILTDCNRAALELVGRAKSEIVGQHQRILHPAHEIEGDSARVFKQHQKQDGVLEAHVITKTGEIKDVSIKSSHVVVRDRKMLQGAFRDVTESKKAQNELLVSEEKYRETIQNANIGVVAYGSDDTITILNPTMQKMTGYTLEEIHSINEWFVKLYPNEVERQKIKDKWFKKLTEVGEVKEGQATIITKQGEKRIFLFDGFRLQGGDFIAFVRDITELKKIEAHRKVLEGKLDVYSKHLKWLVDLRTAQLKDTNERLLKSERLAAIGELAGMIGHDLRNPLAAIKNVTYFLKKKGTTISETQNKEMLETIEKAIEHSDKIINDLLDYAREMRLELTKYSARTLVDDTLRMIKVPNRIRIINHVQEDTLIWVNADKLMRVFINLIKNAIDAIPEKGTLEISSCQTKDCIEISFADTGTGIPEETLKKLFTPLFTTKAQGMGFGLAICKHIIEAHEGNINVKTEVNKGTTFTITLPIKPNANVECEKTFITTRRVTHV